jgi:hypothetical protein
MKKTEFPLSQTIMRLAELGLDENEIVYSLGITKRKFTALKEQKEIANALCSGEETRARKVEDALFRRAIGFEYEEIVNASTSPSAGNSLSRSKNPHSVKNGSISKPALKSTEKSSAKSTIKTVIPDVTACIFWLKNRQADKWRDSKDAANGKKSLIEAMEDYDEETENK